MIMIQVIFVLIWSVGFFKTFLDSYFRRPEIVAQEDPES
jgi:hypothetical protein